MKDKIGFEERISDPSYGMISLARVNGGKEDEFFGSDVRVHNYIELTIHKGSVQRGYGKDWFSGIDGEIIKVKLTPVQYAEMLTNMNCGYGVPCTIEFREGVGLIPFKPMPSKLDVIVEEQIEKEEEKITALEEVRETLCKLHRSGKLPKSVAKELLDKLDNIIWTFSKKGKMYCHENVKGEIDRMVAEAKAEVSAFVEHKIYSTGLEAIKDSFNFPRLDVKSGEEDE